MENLDLKLKWGLPGLHKIIICLDTIIFLRINNLLPVLS